MGELQRQGKYDQAYSKIRELQRKGGQTSSMIKDRNCNVLTDENEHICLNVVRSGVAYTGVLYCVSQIPSTVNRHLTMTRSTHLDTVDPVQVTRHPLDGDSADTGDVIHNHRAATT